MNYVKSLAKQLGPKGIRVNGVAPGPIWTPLQVSGGAIQEKLKQFGGQTPLGRPGQPAELASIYVQLAASDASFCHRTSLRLFGRKRSAVGAGSRASAPRKFADARGSSSAITLHMTNEISSPDPDQSDNARTGVTRRKMLATSAGALVGASMIGRAQGATTTDIGDMKPHVDFSLHGKSALVTGAARGIGRAIAVALAAAGADVMGLDICAVAAPNLVYPPATADDLAATGKLVEAQKRRWIGVTADIRHMAAMKTAVERTVKEFGKLDIAIANAAIQICGSLAEMSDENWKNVIDVNLNGTANTLRACPICSRENTGASSSSRRGRGGTGSRTPRRMRPRNGA